MKLIVKSLIIISIFACSCCYIYPKNHGQPNYSELVDDSGLRKFIFYVYDQHGYLINKNTFIDVIVDGVPIRTIFTKQELKYDDKHRLISNIVFKYTPTIKFVKTDVSIKNEIKKIYEENFNYD